MKQISDSDRSLNLRIFSIVREPLQRHPDRKVVNAIRRADLLAKKFNKRNEKKKPKDPHP